MAGKIGRTVADSTPEWPQAPRPPKGAPNILVVLFDDVGFSDFGCYGSPIATPTIDAIAGRGLVIDHTSHVAKMLDRTGKDLGKTKKMYGEDQGQVFSFCSATVSRSMMEADPHSIVMCPYSIVVYKVPRDKNVYLSYRKPAATHNPALKESLAEMEKLLGDIIKDAM